MRHTAEILTKQNPDLFPKTNQIVMRGARIQEVSMFLKNQYALPKKVVIQIGSNNLRQSKTPNHVMRPLWLTIEANQGRFPDTQWFIGSIPYRDDCRIKFVEETNKALEFMCRQLKINFIDNTELINESHVIWDGVHLNQIGSQIQADRIMLALGLKEKESPRPTPAEENQTPTPPPNPKLASNTQEN